MRGAISREWLWRFDGHAPEAIWTSLADTARFNEAAALPKHEVEEIAQPDGSVRYFGRCRLGPLKLAWREQPANWVHAQWFEHCRYFENGPLRSLCADLRLAPTDHGCEARYRIAAEPAGLLGSVMLRSGLFFRRAGVAFTRLADDARQYAAGARATPFDFPPPRLPQGARDVLPAWSGGSRRRRTGMGSPAASRSWSFARRRSTSGTSGPCASRVPGAAPSGR